jgi:microcystin-dependent protein
MAYKVTFTETTNPAKPPINVNDQELNTSTSLTFPGKNYAGYGSILAENFLHLLENFARGTAPGTQPGEGQPVQGQLWYDNTPGVNLLKVFDGTSWTAAGNIKKASPSEINALSSSSYKGDLWVDTTNQQLYIYSGSTWLLVGPQFSDGTKSGPLIETITDASNVDHTVTSIWAEDSRVLIISSSPSFTPKQTISGFSSINKGLNINSTDIANRTSPIKMWGVAQAADSLVINGRTVGAANFMRNDDISTTNFPINVAAAGGVTVGSQLNFIIGTDESTGETGSAGTSSSGSLYASSPGGSIRLKVNNAGNAVVAAYISSIGRTGLGLNNTNPAEVLDVLGNIKASGDIYTVSATDSLILGTGSLVTNGGLSVLKSTNIGGSLTLNNKLLLNNLDVNNTPVNGSVILPQYTNLQSEVTSKVQLVSAPLYDIGSPTRKFRNVYAETFVGNFTGTLSTAETIQGSISGSAARLAGSTRFSIGDSLTPGVPRSEVVSNIVSFDGQGDDPVIFTATVTQDIIANKPSITDSSATDMFLVYRGSGSNPGLKQISKASLFYNVATVPVGAVFPFAGIIIPNGYLLCDGSEVTQTDYPELFAIIQFTYKAQSQLSGLGTFALPDLRGRFPLGLDNMDNNNRVPSKDSPIDPVTGLVVNQINIDAGGGPAGRVTDTSASNLGNPGGADKVSLETKNVPDHRHTLNSGVAQYYAAGDPTTVGDSASQPGYGFGTSVGSGVPNTGGVITSESAIPFSVMNPYQALNYVIYTGKI